MADVLNGFDWNVDDDIVIKQVDAIAVYINKNRDVVIRQQHPYGDDDGLVIIPPDRVGTLVDALRKCAGEANGHA